MNQALLSGCQSSSKPSTDSVFTPCSEIVIIADSYQPELSRVIALISVMHQPQILEQIGVSQKEDMWTSRVRLHSLGNTEPMVKFFSPLRLQT